MNDDKNIEIILVRIFVPKQNVYECSGFSGLVAPDLYSCIFNFQNR